MRARPAEVEGTESSGGFSGVWRRQDGIQAEVVPGGGLDQQRCMSVVSTATCSDLSGGGANVSNANGRADFFNLDLRSTLQTSAHC